MIGQCHSRIERGAGQARKEECRTRKKDGRGFTCGSLQAEDDSGKDAGQRFFQNDALNGLPAGGTQRDTHGAELLRYRA